MFLSKWVMAVGEPAVNLPKAYLQVAGSQTWWWSVAQLPNLWEIYPETKKYSQILLMIQKSGDHHLECINPVNNGMHYLSTGAGFLPSTAAPENGWLEDDRFLLGPRLFSERLLLVLGSIAVDSSCNEGLATCKHPSCEGQDTHWNQELRNMLSLVNYFLYCVQSVFCIIIVWFNH